SPSSSTRAQTTNAMKATGTGPILVEIALVTEEAMYPSGAERKVKASPPNPMYVTRGAATGVNFAKRINEPLRRPTPTAHKNMRTNPSAHMPGDLPSKTKNDASTTRKPASGPTDRSIPPSSSAKVCPREMNPSAAQANMTALMLKSET